MQVPIWHLYERSQTRVAQLDRSKRTKTIMKTSYTLSQEQLREKLKAFYDKEIEPHGIVDEMSLREYSGVRRRLSVLLDDLAYPIAKLDYNEEETEWHDVWDTVVFVFRQVFEDQGNETEVSQDQLLEFKQRLLDKLDAMTEE